MPQQHTRRSALVSLAASAGSLFALPRANPYSRCLPDFLTALAREAYAKRNAALAAVTTAQTAKARQEWVRETLWSLIGGRPLRTSLATETVAGGSFTRDGYRVEKLSYESRPGTRIPANLYIPTTGQGPFPGVLFQMGHSLNGKAAAPYQKCCQGLAKLGYLVLAFDPMGQGERTYLGIGDADEEHSRPGRQMLLMGDTATRFQLWDAVRSLDVLAAHPLVDPSRLASTGQSGGGTLTMLLAAVDGRLRCAAVSCGITENFACKDFNSPGSTDDAEQNFIDSGPLGFDRWDLLYPMAPKPLLVMVSERDEFGTYSPNYLRSGEEEFAKLQKFYATMGAAPGTLEWKTTKLPHGLSHPLRVGIYDFFERRLRPTSRGVVAEPEVRPEPDAQLLVGVPKPSRLIDQAPTPKPIGADSLRRLLRIGNLPKGASNATVIGRDRGEQCEIETLDIASELGVVVPAYRYKPLPADAERSARPTLLLLEPGGRTRRWREGELCQNLAAKSGVQVVAFDVRGIGELTPEAGRGNWFHARSHADEESNAWASLILGRSLLGQRVTDILAVVEACGRAVTLAGAGSMAVPALCAAALDPRIRTVYLSGGLVSWTSLLVTDNYKETFANFLPGVLRQTDLPHIARTIAPRRVVIAGAVNGEGKTVEADSVKRLYGDGVEVRATAEPWTEAAMAALLSL